MTGHNDFSDGQLRLLAKAEKTQNGISRTEILRLFPDPGLRAKVFDETDLGFKITGLGRILLNEAHSASQILHKPVKRN